MEISGKRIHEIVNDLLPCYVDGTLGEVSAQLVQEHVRDCEKCRKMLDAMERGLLGGNSDRSGYDMKVEQAFRKTRRGIKRRMVSMMVICVLLLGCIVMVMHEVRKEGICFSNLREVRQTQTLMEVWKQQGSASAVKKMDPHGQYEALCALGDLQNGPAVYLTLGWIWNQQEYETQRELPNLPDQPTSPTVTENSNFITKRQLTIGGEAYQLSPRANCYYYAGNPFSSIPSVEASEEEVIAFWYAVMTESEVCWMVPEELYLQVLAAYGSMVTDYGDIISAKVDGKEYTYPKDCEIRSIAGVSGVYYYRESALQHASGGAVQKDDAVIPSGLFLHTDAREISDIPDFFWVAKQTDLMPLPAYEEYMETVERINGWFRDYKEFYEEMGEEEFALQWRRQLASGLEALEVEGKCLTDYRYLGCQYDERREEWSVCYRVMFSNGYVGKVWLNAASGRVYLEYVNGSDRAGSFPGMYAWEYKMRGVEDIPAEEQEFFQRIYRLLWHEEDIVR